MHIVHVTQDPETENEYTFEIHFDEKGVEIIILGDREEPTTRRGGKALGMASVYIETYGGKCQAVLVDAKKQADTGGDNPDVYELFQE